MAGDNSWSALVQLDEEAARRGMRERFSAVAKLPPDERQERLKAMIVAEYELDQPQLFKFTTCRLATWVQMEEGEANVIADGYNAVFNQLPSEMAMRRATVVQMVARGMTPEEVAALHKLIPSLVGQIPVVKRVSDQPASAPPTPAHEARKPGWKFWQRG